MEWVILHIQYHKLHKTLEWNKRWNPIHRRLFAHLILCLLLDKYTVNTTEHYMTLGISMFKVGDLKRTQIKNLLFSRYLFVCLIEYLHRGIGVAVSP